MHLESYQVQQLREILREEIRNVIQEIKQGEKVLPLPPLSIQEVADRYGKSKATVHNWMKKGSITGFKQGKGRFFHLEELEKSFAQYRYHDILESKGLVEPRKRFKLD